MKRVTSLIAIISVFFFWFCLSGNAAIFIVNTTFDNVPVGTDPLPFSGTGTLRQAIVDANNTPGHDIIQFQLVGSTTIQPTWQLTQLTDNAGVTIDGFSQTGSSSGTQPPTTATLIVELNGAIAGGAHGLFIVSDSNIIQGIIVNDFEQDGIRIEANHDTTSFNLIYSCFIGTDPSGILDIGNGRNMASLWGGVSILAPAPCQAGWVCAYNTVKENLISGNFAQGVNISNCPEGDVFGNLVEKNFIGTDINGIDFNGPFHSNDHDGVYIGEGAHDNTVDNNIISDNGYEGVCITGLLLTPPMLPPVPINTYNNLIINNTIGLDINLAPLQNFGHGVSIGVYGSAPNAPHFQMLGFAPNNTIETNTIAHNFLCGVMVWEHSYNLVNADQNKITQNSIYNNGTLGIDLDDDGITLNDPGDADSRANEDCNFPIINSATISGSNTTISGTAPFPNPNLGTVEVFIADATSGNGEGKIYLGSAIPDALGNWTLVTSATVTITDPLTATSTDQFNNTSEFSANFGNVVLPVELLAFDVEAKENFNLISWMTEVEIDLNEFVLLRAKKENTFEHIATIESQGGMYTQEYSFEDYDILPNQGYYYQLKVIDLDGKASFSNIIFVISNVNKDFALSPNPAKDYVFLDVNKNNVPLNGIRIYDLTGKLIKEILLSSDLESRLQINTSDLAPGVYLVRIISPVAYNSLKLIKN